MRVTAAVAALFGLAFLALGLFHGRSTVAHQKEAYTYYARYFEARMGLPPAEIVFVEAELNHGQCGHVGFRPVTGKYGVEFEGPAVWFSIDPKCDEFEVAIQESCHRRWQHHRMALSPDLQHEELVACVKAYKIHYVEER